MLKIRCTCGKDFKPAANMLIEHHQTDGLIELYYICPHCKANHHVCYSNKKIKKLQKMIDNARWKGEEELCRELCKQKKNLMDQLNKR